MIVDEGKADGRWQRDGAFKDATQIHVTVPPEGIKLVKIFILNSKFSGAEVPKKRLQRSHSRVQGFAEGA